LHFVGVWDTVFAADSQGHHEQRLAWNVGSAYQALAIHEVRVDFSPQRWRRKCRHQLVKQTWFRGSHSDIGGGNGNIGLSSVAFEWMVEQVQAHPHLRPGHRLEFDSDYIKEVSDARPHAPLTYPQHSFPFSTLRWRARKMGHSWHGQSLEFRDRHADPDPAAFSGQASETELRAAEDNSRPLPIDK
jgi:hypothetical protein